MTPRWSTPFGRWVRGYGAARLAYDVGMAVHGQPLAAPVVYQWIGGHTVPRPTHAQRIVRLAAGALTLEDVYGHRDALAGKGSGRG